MDSGAEVSDAGRIVAYGAVLAATSLLLPVLVIPAVVLGAIAASRGRAGAGAAIMTVSILLAVTGAVIGLRWATRESSPQDVTVSGRVLAAEQDDTPELRRGPDEARRARLEEALRRAGIRGIVESTRNGITATFVEGKITDPDRICRIADSVIPGARVVINESRAEYGTTSTSLLASCSKLITP